VSIWDALRPLNELDPQVALADEYHAPKNNTLNKSPINPHKHQLRGCITTSGGENYHYSGTRLYTVRELALLQTFGLGFVFTGTQGEAKKQVGNAIPPIVEEAMLRKIVQTLRAFDNGLVSAEDDLLDLDVILESFEDAQPLSRSSFATRPPSAGPSEQPSEFSMGSRRYGSALSIQEQIEIAEACGEIIELD
jgi:DNA (cytosine-5)-methyltransferase 1